MSFREFTQVWDAEKVRLIDVREWHEWDEVHVEGAEFFPLSRIQHGVLPESDGRPTYVMCKAGGRSAMAITIMEARGFDECTNLTDGILGALSFDELLKRG